MVGREQHPVRIQPAESAGFFLPSKELLPSPSHIYYAGQSDRRRHFLKSIFPDVNVTTICVDPEPKTADLDVIVNHKLGIVLNDPTHRRSGGAIIVAADTQTIVPALDRTGAIVETYKTKPSSDDEVRKLFDAMSRLRTNPEYSVESASAIHHVIGEVRSPTHLVRTRVELDRSQVAYLATEVGFSLYRDVFDDFYGSDAYGKNGLPQIGPCDISSGLSLPVLTRIGAVRAIDEVAIDGDTFREAFKRALHIVAIGFSPELFRDYELEEFVWIEEVTRSVLL